jgi:competence protein ComEC
MHTGGTFPRCFAMLARRPAVLAAAMFIAGILAHQALPHTPAACIAAAVALAMLAIGHFRHPLTSSSFLAGALFLTGAAAAQIEAFFYSPDDVAAYVSDDPRLARVELRIDDAPRILDAHTPGRRPLPPRQVTRGTVTRILTRSGWRPAAGKVLVQLQPPNARLAIGEHVRALGMLQRPGPAMNPGQFDWSSYYREQRVLSSIAISHAEQIEILTPPHPGPLDRLQSLARGKLAAGFDAAHALDHALLRALVLGDNDPQLRDVQEQFRRTGTSHHLAISGMHIAVLGFVIFQLCRLMRLNPRRSAIVGIAAVIVYGLAALPSPPVVRSVLLCLAFAAGICSGRAGDSIQLLALSVLLMLIYHPLDYYTAGFQLSFLTVLGLMVLSRLFSPDFSDSDARAARSALSVRIPLRTRLARRGTTMFGPMIWAGIIAWLVSLPLIAVHFEQLNPWAVFASLLLAPFVFLALVGGFAKILLTLALPMFAPAWAALAGYPVALMRHVIAALARLPGSDVPMPAPSAWMIGAYYALLLLPLLPAAIPLLRRVRRFAPAGAVCMLALSPAASALTSRQGALRVSVLAVGAGSCAVIDFPDGRTMLLDAGSATLQDLQRNCLGPFLRHAGKRSIDAMLLSHGDFDHISAAGAIASAYDVRQVMMSPHFLRHAAESATAERLVETFEELKLPPRLVHRGEQITIGGAELQILWPPEQSTMDSNNTGVVVRLSYAGRSILFPADIQEPAEQALLADPASLHADVLIAPHHGSSEPSTRAFLAAVDPELIVSSNDRTLTQKQRAFDAMAWDRPLYRTNRCGAVTMTISKTGDLTTSTFLQRK